MAFILGQGVLATDKLGAGIPTSQQWSVKITLGGVDITGSLTDEISVNAEERLARTAAFSYFPNTSMDGSVTIDPDDWVGQTVSIEYNDGSAGFLSIFKGNVNLAEYDPITRIASFNASDLLQETFENTTTTEEVLELIPTGRYSENVLGVRENGWLQAEQIMSTTPYDVHIDRNGTLQNIPWAVSSIAQIFDASMILQRSVSFNNLRRRDIVNSLTYKYQLRFARLKERSHSLSWDMDRSMCDFLTNSSGLPTKDMVREAATGSGWTVGTIRYNELASGAWYRCFIGSVYNAYIKIAWITTPSSNALLALGATWTAYKKYSQTLTETYDLIIKSDASISKYGLLVDEDGASSTSEYDTSLWTTAKESEQVQGNYFRELPTGGSEQIDPSPLDKSQFETDSINDLFNDVFDEEVRVNDLETFIAIGRTRLLEVHRRNYVQWVSPLMAYRDLRDTVRINYTTVDATGKIFKLVHVMNIQSGQATTTFTIAVSRGSAGPDDGITAPSRPNSDPSVIPNYPSVAQPPPLRTYLGGTPNSPPYDEKWTGLITNATSFTAATWDDQDVLGREKDYVDNNTDPDDLPQEGETTVNLNADALTWNIVSSSNVPESDDYPSEFVVEMPEIEAEATDDFEPSYDTPLEIAVSIPQDPLVYKA